MATDKKRQLQRQMERTRDSIAETVGEIKETVEQQVEAVKDTAAAVINYREEFQKDPLVWSLGALSAGFALGYTVGYAHKENKGGKQSQVSAFAETMIEQLSSMGQGMILPALDSKISEIFGFDFSALLTQAAVASKSAPKTKKKLRRSTAPKALKSGAAKKKPASKKNA
jgi:hypothetical protein